MNQCTTEHLLFWVFVVIDYDAHLLVARYNNSDYVVDDNSERHATDNINTMNHRSPTQHYSQSNSITMSTPTCAQCNTAAADLKRCSHCQYVFYCNKACQKAHWKQHKHACFQSRMIVIKCSNDSSIAYWFLTYAEYLKECDRDGKNHFIPFEC